MTKYDLLWRIIRFLFFAAIAVALVVAAINGSAIAAGVLFAAIAVVLMLAGAIGAIYAGRIHNELILRFLRENAEENKAYLRSLPPARAMENNDSGIVVGSDFRVIE